MLFPVFEILYLEYFLLTDVLQHEGLASFSHLEPFFFFFFLFINSQFMSCNFMLLRQCCSGLCQWYSVLRGREGYRRSPTGSELEELPGDCICSSLLQQKQLLSSNRKKKKCHCIALNLYTFCSRTVRRNAEGRSFELIQLVLDTKLFRIDNISYAWGKYI